MASSIVVNFKVGGVDEIARGFRTVQQAADRLETRTRQGYASDEQLARKASKAKEQEANRLAKAMEQAAKKEQRERDKLTEDSRKAYIKDIDAKIRADETWAKRRATIQENAAKLAYKLAEQEVRDAENVEKRKAATRDRFARATGGQISGTLGSLARGAVGLAGGALSLGGGFGIADAVQQRLALERSAALFSNQTSTMPGGRIATSDIMSRSRAVGISNNVDPAQVAASMQAYFAKASDAQGAMGNAGLFAQLSKATGSDMTQIASVAGALRVQNPNLDEAGMKNMLMGIVGQTRKGAVAMDDLVRYVPGITSTASLYGGDQAKNQQKLIGLSQVAVRTNRSTASAASATSAFGQDIAQNAAKIQSHGVNVKDSSGNLKDPSDIIAEMMEKSGGDIAKLKAMGVGRKSMTIFEAEMGNFQRAGGGAAGAAAVRKDVSSFTEGGYDEKSLAADVANVQAGAGEKFEQATKRISDVIQEKLAPYMERFADKLPEIIPKVEKFIDAMASLADFFMENPFTGIGAVVLAAITKDLAAAAIGEGIKAAVGKSMGTGGGIAVAGAVAITAMQAWIATGTQEDKDNQQHNAGSQATAASAVAALNADPANPEKIAAAKKALADVEQSQKNIGKKSSFGQVAGMFQSKDEDNDEKERNAKLWRSLADSADKLQKALDGATVAAKKNGAGNGSPAAPNRNQPISGR